VTVRAATSTPAALAAKAATSTIPIVFTTAADPVAVGLVDSLSRPSGNATGVNIYLSDLGAKRLELLRQLVPNAAVIGMLVNPNFPDAEPQSKDVKKAAGTLGQQVHIVNANSEGDFNGAFATFVELKADALLVSTDSLFLNRREQLVALAARHKIPAIYFEREFVVAGGLMSYAANLADGYRQAGITSAGFSGAPRQAIYRWCGRRSLISSSTSRPPRRSVWQFPIKCSRSPTR
jgi:putative ABC transport system substrate-binding protein